jgi:hypothetical protein
MMFRLDIPEEELDNRYHVLPSPHFSTNEKGDKF